MAFQSISGRKINIGSNKKLSRKWEFLTNRCEISTDGENVVVSDKGGRVIIFKKSEQKGKQPKLDYFFEFPA